METSRAERVAWIQLRQIPQLGPVRFLRLIRSFGSAQVVFDQPASRLKEAGVSASLAEDICRGNNTKTRMEAEQELDKTAQKGIRILLYNEPDYPINLKSIYAPPPYIYVQGELKPQDRLAVAIVGSRRCDREGLQIAGELAEGLARKGITIVSGFARGIDSAAHRKAIEAGGRTLAVLGNGLNYCYPPENKDLLKQLPSHGAVLSELALDTEPRRENFPPRNRIIAGLSLGVIVVEAPERSGALITADVALQQNREVFAVPGSVKSGCHAGCHRLLKEGAILVENEWDVLQALAGTIERITAEIGLEEVEKPQQATAPPVMQELPFMKQPAPPVLSSEEQTLWNILPDTPMHIDHLARLAGLEVSKVLRLLLGLQLKQLVRQSAGMQFSKAV